MQTLDDIQTALAQLPLAQRERVFSWLGDALDEGVVKEAAASYDSSPEPHWLSFEDYLAFEEASPVRHEYVGGMLHAMAGASESHEIIAGNLFAAIHAHLRGRPCTSAARPAGFRGGSVGRKTTSSSNRSRCPFHSGGSTRRSLSVPSHNCAKTTDRRLSLVCRSSENLPCRDALTCRPP